MFGRKQIALDILTDEGLYLQMIRGDAGAFNLLYKRYQGKLLYYFYRMLGKDKTLAQDFLQEIFYKIIDKPHLFDPKRKFSTWVYSVAHNMCKNEYRGKAVRKIIIKGQNADSFYENTTYYPENDQLIEAIFKELELFDESHRTAFLLKYREGLGIDEIGEILGLPVGTVKSRLFYTRKRLQEVLLCKYAETIETLF
jgi:RNA polymerase sigma-70 factor (ECF subfamily)